MRPSNFALLGFISTIRLVDLAADSSGWVTRALVSNANQYHVWCPRLDLARESNPVNPFTTSTSKPNGGGSTRSVEGQWGLRAGNWPGEKAKVLNSSLPKRTKSAKIS